MPKSAPSTQKAGGEAAARAGRIRTVLSDVPMTAAKIDAALCTDYTAFQVANTVKLIPGIGITIVKRRTSTGGVTKEMDYTTYYLGTNPAAPRPTASRTLASEPGVHMEEIAPKDGESARLRVTFEQKLRGIGFFSFAAKRAAREEIGRLAGEVSEAQQRLASMMEENRRKAEEILKKHPFPTPPASSGGGRRSFKAASADTLEKSRKIESVLSPMPMTAAEIDRAMGKDYTALQVANAVKFLLAGMVKILRVETNRQGELVLREYSAYYLV